MQAELETLLRQIPTLEVEVRVGTMWGHHFIPGLPKETWEALLPKQLVPCIINDEFIEHVRVSRDEHGQILSCIRKEQVFKKDYPIGGPFFARISAARETPVPLPPDTPMYYRRKKRWSVGQFGFKVDMTMVWSSTNILFEDPPIYELEIEGLEAGSAKAIINFLQVLAP